MYNEIDNRPLLERYGFKSIKHAAGELIAAAAAMIVSIGVFALV